MERILRWESNRARINQAETATSTAQHRTTRRQGSATTLAYSADMNIAQWVAELRQNGVPVSNLYLEYKAKEVAADLGLNSQQF